MAETFVRDGNDVRSLRKIFVRDGTNVRQLEKLWARDGSSVRLIYNRIKEYLLSGTAITTVAALIDIQTITVTGRSNVFIPPINQEIELRVSSNFDSGGFSGSSNSSTTVATTINLGNGVSIIVENTTVTGREQVVLAPANNGASINNPETATFNPGTGTFRVNWDGGTSSSQVAPYRVFTSTGGTAGTRVTGGSSTRFPGGYAGFDEGAYTGGINFTAANIPNPISLPAGSSVGGVTTDAGGSPVLASYIGGIQDSSNNDIRMAFVHGRGRNFAYVGEGASSFSQRFYFLNSGATGVRPIIFGPTVTYERREARLVNNSGHTITLTGSIGGTSISGTLANGASTATVMFNGNTANWNLGYTNTVASWSGTAAGNAISNRNFSNNIGADAALNEISTAILAAVTGSSRDGGISTSGSNRIQRINLGATDAATSFIYNVNQGVGNFTFTRINVGQTEFGVASTYTVRSPNGMQLGTFTSSVTDAGASDANNVADSIRSIIQTMTEQPVNYTATRSNNVVTATAASAAAAAGVWSVTVDHDGQQVNGGTTNFIYGNPQVGANETTPTQIRVTRVTNGTSANQVFTLNSAESTDAIGARIATYGTNGGVTAVYNNNTNRLTFTGLEDTDSLTVVEIRDGNGITLVEQ